MAECLLWANVSKCLLKSCEAYADRDDVLLDRFSKRNIVN